MLKCAILLNMNQPAFIDVSHVAPDILNAALGMSLEWGENWLKPINQRIQEAYPELTAEAANNLNNWCLEVQKYAFALVEKDYPLERMERTAMAQVRHQYPMLNHDNLSRLYNQGMYYAWHG